MGVQTERVVQGSSVGSVFHHVFVVDQNASMIEGSARVFDEVVRNMLVLRWTQREVDEFASIDILAHEIQPAHEARARNGTCVIDNV